MVSPLFRNLRSLRTEKVRIKVNISLVEENLVREYLNNLDTHKSLVPDMMHSQVLRKLTKVTASPLSIISARSEKSGEDIDD